MDPYTPPLNYILWHKTCIFGAGFSVTRRSRQLSRVAGLLSGRCLGRVKGLGFRV